MNLTALFADPQSDTARRLADLGQRRRELQTQQRDALLALNTARDEHTRFADDIQTREAKALALGHDDNGLKRDQAELTKLTAQVDQYATHAHQLGRAVTAIDEEITSTAVEHNDELIVEAIQLHNTARERITELATELRQQHATLRSAYVAAQSVLAAAGRSHLSRHLRDTPSVEVLAQVGEAPELLDEDFWRSTYDQIAA